MKKYILFLAFNILLFGCTKDNLNTKSDSAIDLSQMVPKKIFKQSSKGMYYGVFGHSTIKDLHGKIFINAGNDGNYSALIKMINGSEIKFIGDFISDTHIQFKSSRGRFDFNASNISVPEATNVFIDKESEAYIVVKKSTRSGGGLIAIGTYEESGNESNFWGNFDMIGKGVDTGIYPDYSEYVSHVIVSHLELPNPYIDLLMESSPPSECLQLNQFPVLIDNGGANGGIIVYNIIAEGQNSHFGESDVFWRITRIFPEGYYDNNCNLLGLEGSGSWKWNSRKGKIY